MPLEEVIAAHHANKTGASLHYLTLYSIAYGLEAKKIFEFGSGYSSMALLEALGVDGKLISCDIRPREEAVPFRQYDNYSNWEFINKPSTEAKEDIARRGPYDLVLHDGSHYGDEVAADIFAIIPYIKRFGILLVHDTQHSELGEDMRAGVRKGLGWAAVPYSMTTLPYGYGLTIIRIEGNAHNGDVTLTRKKLTSDGTSVPAKV